MSMEDGLVKLFEKIYTKDNAGMFFAIDVQRKELIFISKTMNQVDEYVATSGYDETYDRILYGKVPDNIGTGM